MIMDGVIFRATICWVFKIYGLFDSHTSIISEHIQIFVELLEAAYLYACVLDGVRGIRALLSVLRFPFVVKC